MNEKPYIEKLEKFAKENNLEFYTNSNVNKHTFVPNEKFMKSEYVIFDLDNISKDLHLVFSDRLSTRQGSSSAYCGLFLLLPECRNEIKLRKRFTIDRINFSKRFKTGTDYIDRKVIIISNNKENIPIKVNSKNVGDFINLSKEIMPIEITTIKESLSFIPLLHGKNWLALTVERRWLLDSRKLKTLVHKGSKILLSMKT